MNTDLNEFPWATAMTVFVTVVVSLVGGAVVLFGHDGALSFEKYVEILTGLGVANGLLGIGRGVRSAAKMNAMRR